MVCIIIGITAAKPHKSQVFENTKRQCFQPCISAGVFCVSRARRGYYVSLIHDHVRYSLTFISPQRAFPLIPHYVNAYVHR